MNELLAFAAHNTVAAAVLALFVFVLTRSRRNPPLAHMLWILVLIRLLAPPVMRVEWSALDLSTWNGQRELILANLPRFDRQPPELHSEIVSEANAHPSSASTANVDLALRTVPLWNRACYRAMLALARRSSCLRVHRRDAHRAFRAAITRHTSSVGAAAASRRSGCRQARRSPGAHGALRRMRYRAVPLVRRRSTDHCSAAQPARAV